MANIAVSKPVKSSGLVYGTIERIGEIAFNWMEELHTQVSFTGEIFVKSLNLLVHPGRLRWGDTFLVVEKAGADGVGITALLGFLIGVILSRAAGLVPSNQV